ncbi:MAG: 23S rRNA (uracil(1939)-C(5))-methyltransferase RlmD [Bacteroidales bacterium]|nr:23S rRNA (uracil(1939)-C(5))-methyltransferase RlmD [Bacteroidales bacterium]
MSGRKKRKVDLPLLEKVEILDAGAEGKAVARVDNMVVFVPFAAPGDVVDIKVVSKKKSFYEGKIVKYHHLSEKRVEPRCEHFGLCGGCKWQHLGYEHQLFFKQKQVVDNFTRIGKLTLPPFNPIIASEEQYFYRNKLEFSFSNRKWLLENKIIQDTPPNANGLGMHLPGMYDRIVDLENCYLQAEPSNSIRLALRDWGILNNLTFYDSRVHRGFLRTATIRTSSTGETMVIIAFGANETEQITALLDHLLEQFPQITSLFYVVNPKHNDTINDLEIQHYSGKNYIVEKMEDLNFKVGPLSFYQTNSRQALRLYQVVREFAGFEGHETVYDLYCGTGTITNFIAKRVGKVIGVEYIPEAIDDAIENSKMNRIGNTRFVVGDIAETLNEQFVSEHGKPQMIITDPPRAGMHPKVIQQLLNIEPQKIVYVSCNPATQARDIALLAEKYVLEQIQPVDMFPQTHHVENVSLLVRKFPIQEQLVKPML